MNITINTAVLPPGLRAGLEDLVGDVVYARKADDLARLALLCYCEIRRWARIADEQHLAELCSSLVAHEPAGDRTAFLQRIDLVIAELAQVCERAGVNFDFRFYRRSA